MAGDWEDFPKTSFWLRTCRTLFCSATCLPLGRLSRTLVQRPLILGDRNFQGELGAFFEAISTLKRQPRKYIPLNTESTARLLPTSNTPAKSGREDQQSTTGTRIASFPRFIGTCGHIAGLFPASEEACAKGGDPEMQASLLHGEAAFPLSDGETEAQRREVTSCSEYMTKLANKVLEKERRSEMDGFPSLRLLPATGPGRK